MRLIGLLHVLALCLITYITIRPMRLPLAGQVAGALVLLWSNLVLTGQFLSLFSALNSVPSFFGVSVVFAVGMAVFLNWLRNPDESVSSFGSTQPLTRYELIILALFMLTGIVALAANILIAVTHIASNPDTIVYRFPRVYWYLTQGSFAHFATGTDPRIVYYPSNGVMLYLPLVLYRFGALWFNLPTLLAWCAIPAICYAFARDLGAARFWAAAAAWCVALTPNVLIQALSTNDEILAATSLLAGLFFLHRWFRTESLVALLLGVLGLGLSVGTKLHAFFYWPYILLIGIGTMIAWRRTFALASTLWSLRGASVAAVCIVAAAAFVFSFIVYNLRATGQVTEYGFARQVLNTPFNPLVAAQTIAVYAAQIILSPFPDILPTAGYSGARIPHYTAYNSVWAPMFTWVNNGPAFTSVGYRFTGVVSSISFFLNEHTVMLGFSWLASMISAIWIATHRQAASSWALWIGLSFPAWFLCWAASTKYIEGIPVYVAYAAIVSSPAWAFALGPIGSLNWSRLRWAALIFVAITHVLTASTILALNTSRSAAAGMAAIFAGTKQPRSVGFTVDPSVTEELARATSGLTHHTIVWGQPNWVFMAFSPQVAHRLQSNSLPFPGDNLTDPNERMMAYNRGVRMPRPDDATMHIYPIRQFPAYGHAVVKVRSKATPGLTLLGELQFALGPEWVFAAGNDVHKRHPGSNGYLVFTFNEVSDFGHNPQPVLHMASSLIGLDRDDDLSFSFAVTIDGNVVSQTDWQTTPEAKLSTLGLNATNGVLTIRVRDNKAGGHVDTAEIKLRATTPPVLPR